MELSLVCQDLLSDACHNSHKVMHWSNDHKLSISARDRIFVMDTSRLVDEADDPKSRTFARRIFPVTSVNLTPGLKTFFEEDGEINVQQDDEDFNGNYKFRPIHSKLQTRLQHVPYTHYDVTVTDESVLFRDVRTCRCSLTGQEFMTAFDVKTSRCYLWKRCSIQGKMVAMANVSSLIKRFWESKGDVKWTESLLPRLVINFTRWLDFSLFTNFHDGGRKQSGVFCVGTQSGHLIMYTVAGEQLEVYNAIKCKHKRVASVCMMQPRSHWRENPSQNVHIAVAFSNGVVTVYTIELESGIVDSNSAFDAWDEQDHLEVVDLTWTSLDDGGNSLMVFGKANSLVMQKVSIRDDVLDCQENIVDNLSHLHIAQIKLLCMQPGADGVTFKIITSSDDGRILMNEFRLQEKVECLSSNELLPGLRGYPVNSHLNGLEISPNGVFMATVVSQRLTGIQNTSISHDPKSYINIYVFHDRGDLVEKLMRSEKPPFYIRDMFVSLKLHHDKYHCEVKRIFEAKNFKSMNLRELQAAAGMIQAVVSLKHAAENDSLLLGLLNKARRRLFTMRAVSLLDSILDKIHLNKDDDEKLKYIKSLKTVLDVKSGETTQAEISLRDSLNTISNLNPPPCCEITGSTLESLIESNLFRVENSVLWPNVCCLTLHPIYQPPYRRCLHCNTFATIFPPGSLPGWLGEKLNFQCPVCSGYMT